MPEGDRDTQRLVLYTKSARAKVRRQAGEGVSFVPLVGRHGWSES